MALARKVMGGGFSAGQALAIGGDVTTAISAAGTTLATATTTNSSFNIISTCAAGAGVSLPAASVGDTAFVYNGGAGYAVIYPNTSSETINQLAAGAGMVLAINTGCEYFKVTTTKWYAQLSA